MPQNVVVQLIGNNLDPTAQEFWPTYPTHLPHPSHFPFISQQPPPPPPFLLLPPPQPQLPPPPPLQQPAFLPPAIPPAANSPTRAVLLSAVPPETSESCVRRDLEYFGDVRAVQMERVLEGILTVHFYDLRAACAALDSIRHRHIQNQYQLRVHYSNSIGTPPLQPPPPPPPGPGIVSGRAVWAHFTVPVTHAFPDGLNQGTIVVFNLDPNVSAVTLKNIFQVFGPVKELRETPMKKQQRFVEFFDVRDAARALSEMNGKEINERTVMIEYSRPGGHFNKFHNNFHIRNHNTSNINNNRRNNMNNMRPHSSYSPPPPRTPPVQSRALPFRNRRSSPRQHLNARRRRSSSGSDGSIEAALGRLTLRSQTRHGSVVASNSSDVKSISKKGNDSCSGSGQTKQKVVRPWKGRQKNYDPRYLIKEEAIIIDDNSGGGVGGDGGSKDTRTTVMIKNIPNKYSQKLLLSMLDNHCIHCNEQIVAGDDQQQQPLSSYDFVYLPIDFNNKCNVGYGFVNMTSPEATLRLYKAFHHQHWEVFNSRKICEVTYARVQGLEALKEHFKNSKFACENDEYLPVVFTPPRDGRNHVSSPLPIVFSTPTTSTAQHCNPDMDSNTSTITLPSSDELHDHDHDHDHDYKQVHTITNDETESSVASSSDGGGVIDEEDMS